MAALLKPTYTKIDPKTGRRVKKKSRKWYGQYVDADGVTQRVPLCTDKGAAQAMLSEIVRQVDRKQAGIVDACIENTKRPLSEHLDDYCRFLSAKGDTDEHVDLTISRIKTAMIGCGFRWIGDLSASRFSEWLADARQRKPQCDVRQPVQGTASTYREIARSFGISTSTVRYWRNQGAPIHPRRSNNLHAIWLWRQTRKMKQGGLSHATSNHYLRAMKSFARWLCRERRLGENPFACLSVLNAESDLRRERRTISVDEFQRLVETTRKSSYVFRGLMGTDRAILYLVATYTGLRASELSNVTRGDLSLSIASPTVTVQAAYSKRRRRDVQPIRPDLAAVLRGWIGDRVSDNDAARLWCGSWSEDAAEMLRGDLEAAGIPYEDGQGRVFDFHALRHQFISNLAQAGVHPKIAQQLARHSSITLTMDRYTHLDVAQTADALMALPNVPHGDDQTAAVWTDENDTPEKLALQLALNPGISCPRVSSAVQPTTETVTGSHKENLLIARGFACDNAEYPLHRKRGRRDSNPQPPDRQSGTLTN